MSPPSEDKLLSFLAEIQSDIRQIKSDLQTLLMLLKQHQNAAPVSSSDNDPIAEPAEAGGQPRLKMSFAICERREARMIREIS